MSWVDPLWPPARQAVPGGYIRRRWQVMSCLPRQQDRACATRTLSASALLFIFQEPDQHPRVEIKKGRCSSMPAAPCWCPSSLYNFPESITVCPDLERAAHLHPAWALWLPSPTASLTLTPLQANRAVAVKLPRFHM